MKSYLDHLSLENNDGINKLGTQFLDVFFLMRLKNVVIINQMHAGS
jgi:hypothetical protein